jgi:hypothetical protein
MKRNKIAMISVTFILGAVFGISLIAVLSFVNPANSPSSSPDPVVIPITISDANHYFLNYYAKADSIKDKFKGFYVDRLQLEAMNILATDKNLVGFRLYMGKNNTNENIGIVVGITNTFSDAASGKIYKTESKSSGPCPFLCDVSSPITQEH